MLRRSLPMCVTSTSSIAGKDALRRALRRFDRRDTSPPTGPIAGADQSPQVPMHESKSHDTGAAPSSSKPTHHIANVPLSRHVSESHARKSIGGSMRDLLETTSEHEFDKEVKLAMRVEQWMLDELNGTLVEPPSPPKKQQKRRRTQWICGFPV